MNLETKVQRKIMLALSEAGCIVWRNETAGAWVGKVIHKAGDQVTLASARMMPFGLCEGSSDIIGVQPVTITQEMVGQTVGVFIAQEVKTQTGRASKKQLHFIDFINKKGGVAGIVRSVKDALELINNKNGY